MARVFDGATEFIGIDASFSIGRPLTIFLWIKTTGPPGNTAVSQSTATTGFTFGINGSRTLFIARTNQAITSTDTGVVPSDVWSPIGVSLDGSDNYVFYIGGAVSSSGNASSTITSQANWVINQFVPGSMAEFAIWNDILTTAEMATLAKGYSPLFIRGAALVEYVPMLRSNVSYKRSTPTLTGTSVGIHPRIIMPRGRKLQSGVSVSYVYMRPDADSSDGSWLNELGSNVDLYASVDETTASDTDYIQSSTTSGDKVRLQLSDPGSGVAQPFAIRYRASATTVTASLFGRLYQGASTLIDSWNHTVNTTPTDYTHTVGSTEFALITDFNDLYIEFEYVP